LGISGNHSVGDQPRNVPAVDLFFNSQNVALVVLTQRLLARYSIENSLDGFVVNDKFYIKEKV
jgi:hypothetical protein